MFRLKLYANPTGRGFACGHTACLMIPRLCPFHTDSSSRRMTVSSFPTILRQTQGLPMQRLVSGRGASAMTGRCRPAGGCQPGGSARDASGRREALTQGINPLSGRRALARPAGRFATCHRGASRALGCDQIPLSSPLWCVSGFEDFAGLTESVVTKRAGCMFSSECVPAPGCPTGTAASWQGCTGCTVRRLDPGVNLVHGRRVVKLLPG